MAVEGYLWACTCVTVWCALMPCMQLRVWDANKRDVLMSTNLGFTLKGIAFSNMKWVRRVRRWPMHARMGACYGTGCGACRGRGVGGGGGEGPWQSSWPAACFVSLA